MRASWVFLTLLIAALLAPNKALGDSSTIVVVNHGQEPIVELYIINQSARTWGNDLLGGQALQANQQRPVSVAVGCPCKIKAIYNDGAVRYQQTSGGNPVVFNH